MTGKPNPSWKTLEQLVAQIHANLAPTATVKHNEFIVGKSGAQNQCDVTIRANVAQYSVLCVIECKDWAEKVGVETIRGFVTKLSDVGAAKGAIVAASGFTADAEKLSEHHGIDLFAPVDTEGKWKEISPIPLRVTKVELRGADVETYKEDGTKINFEQSPLALGKPLTQLLFSDAELKQNITYKELLEREWDRITELKIPDAKEWHSIPFGRISIGNGHSSMSAPLSFRYRLIAETKHYYGHVSYKRCQGLG